MANTVFLNEGLAVKRYRILCSGLVITSVWERGKLSGSHGTVMGLRTDEGERLPGWWGRVGTRDDEDRAAQYERARQAIEQAFPGTLATGRFEMGELSVDTGSVEGAVELAGY